MSSPCPVNSLPRANLTDKQYRILTVIVTKPAMSIPSI